MTDGLVDLLIVFGVALVLTLAVAFAFHLGWWQTTAVGLCFGFFVPMQRHR